MNDLTHRFTVDRTPQEVYEAVLDVRGWWSGGIEGTTDVQGGEFTYEVPDIHWTKFRVSELVPGERVAWLTLDSWLSFPEDHQEWTGTTVRFDIRPADGGTELVFTHEGLTPAAECYTVCHTAWGDYVNGSLRDLVLEGAGTPNAFEGPEVLALAKQGRSAR